MGNKQSTKQPPQISVEDKMLLKKQVEQDKEERKNLRKEQDDARAADAAIQQSRLIGSSNYFVSTDNKFKFVVDPNVTQPFVFKEENVGQTKKVPATKFNFFFVRHAKSCANEQAGLLNLKKLKLDDPFISNDGILATAVKKSDYDKFFEAYEPIDHYFCSPLIRTWCTAAMLFTEHISDFEIAPHIREDAVNYTNHPYPYETNVKRFKFFSDYVKTFTDGERTIEGVPGYALMNKALANYGSDFVDQIGIELFMQWYIKNENILGRTNKSIRNVVVVCHSDILKTFCKAHLNEDQLNFRGMGDGDKFFKDIHNYCIQVQVIMPIRKLQTTSFVYAPLTTTEAAQSNALVDQTLAEQKQKHEAIMARVNANNNPVNVSLPAAGGNKHKKTKKKTTRSNKRHNKKTRLAKQRGGGNEQFNIIQTNLPFPMTITKVIEGTSDIPRDPGAKTKDCICYPDAYQNPNITFTCASQQRDNEARGFESRQFIPEVETRAEQRRLDEASAKLRT